MITKIYIFIALFLTIQTALMAQTKEVPPRPQPEIDTWESKCEAVVQKVFKVQDEKFKFIAYQVTWKGVEIIVRDIMCISNYQEGEKIQFVAQKVKATTGDTLTRSLDFILIDIPFEKLEERAFDTQSDTK